ncbi:hypothetical protein RHG08_20770 [Clostridioides difficile]|nr:hypothetical protein [Clostridioides difficile]MDW0092777.1 hypothetical protein [Clostridioides difficile]
MVSYFIQNLNQSKIFVAGNAKLNTKKRSKEQKNMEINYSDEELKKLKESHPTLHE